VSLWTLAVQHPWASVCLAIAVVALALWAIARAWLRGPDLAAFDRPADPPIGAAQPPGPEHHAVVASLGRVAEVLKGVPMGEHLKVLRRYMDDMFPGADPECSITPVAPGAQGAPVPGEWVLAPGADPARRTLYIHGGAYTMGSPRSHRPLTTAFSRLTGGAVFAIDYRLMPEHPRLAGIEDCRAAYAWLLGHGPQGAAAAARVWVAGDSAGGNLTLSLIAWVRDNGLRAPDGAVAFSPATDATLVNPSLRANVATDPMLGPMFGKLTRVPQTLLLWFVWWQNRLRPCDARLSPVYGDLTRLPPTLVQASACEMLVDDARRWVNRARAAGSPAQLQTWAHMVHVWQLFHAELPQGREALEAVRRFIAQTDGPRT